MNNGLQIFTYEGSDVRTIHKDEETWWVLKDVCAILDLTTPAKVSERLDTDEVSLTHITDSIGREQETTIINEAGLYKVILRSDKPSAKAFTRWVTHEVLPSIRKTGMYAVGMPNLSSTDILELQVKGMRELEAVQKQQALALAEVTTTLDTIQAAFKDRPESAEDWRVSVRKDVSDICNKEGLFFQEAWSELYRLLEVRTHTNLKSRLTGRKKRMRKQGCTATEISQVSILCIVSENSVLRHMFDAILREWIMQHTHKSQEMTLLETVG